jgi:hypothetical protein
VTSMGREVARQWKGLVAGLVIGGVLATTTTGIVALQHPRLLSKVRAHLDALGAHAQAAAPTPEPSLNSVAVRVQLTSDRGAISPLIYGVSFGEPDYVKSLGATLNRWGGNAASRFNWVNGHAWNSARDWEFRNGNGGRSGMATDTFISSSHSAGAQPLMTIPTIGWVSKDDNNSTQSIGVPSQAGPPVKPGSQAIAGYDPTSNRSRTSLPSSPTKPGAPGTLQDNPPSSSTTVYQDEWVHHMVDRFGSGAQGVQYFEMDNEPDLWPVTQTDVHPTETSYQEMVSEFTQYADAVKAADPASKILGPDVSGWTGYFYSALDRGTDNFATHADRQTHGDQAFLPWWLHQVAQHDAKLGQRTLDYLDVHYYPQAPNVSAAHASDPATQALRIRSVRSLYDASYGDESWIAQPVMLIPRLKSWVDQQYPGTGIAITEYNFGGEYDASGAVTLAEVLGIYGREGVGIANYWPFPPKDTPAAAAFRLYRNYDGSGGTFGDRELAVSSGQRQVAAFASRHSDTGEVDVILANESLDQAATVHLDVGANGSFKTDEFVIKPGSSQIDHQAVSSLGAELQLAPLSVQLIRLQHT